MRRRNKRKYLFMGILLLSIGFAAVTTTLVLNGTLNLLGDTESFTGDVIFTKAKTEAGGLASIIKEGKEITFTSKELSKVNESTTLNFDITNKNRQYDAIASINCNTNASAYADYITITPNKTEYEISAGGTVSGHLTATLVKSYGQEKATDIAFTCTLNVEAKERDILGDEYVPVEPFSKAGTIKVPDKAFVHWADDDLPRGEFWNYSERITKIVFEDTINVHETDDEYIFDISDSESANQVMAYMVKNGEINDYGNDLFTLYIQSETGINANSDSSGLFANFSVLESIEGLEFFNTSNIINMEKMFYYCNNLTDLEIEEWDTSNVTNMSDMFTNCHKLKKLDLQKWDIRNVTSMSNMFYYCNSLTNLEIGKWDTSNVTNMKKMFYHCTDLTILELQNWNLSQVTNMNSMFDGCTNLTNLNLSSIDFSKVISHYGLLRNMPSNAEIIVKDEEAQQWILNLSSDDRPSSWTTDNIIIKG